MRPEMVGGLVFFFLLTPLIAVSIFNSFFAGTNLRVSYGGKNYTFVTREPDLQRALKKEDIQIFPQDKVSVPLSTKLTGKTVAVNIEKSFPVVIFDGYKKTSGRTTYRDPAKILSENGISFDPKDRLSADLVLDPVSTNSVGYAVKIERSPVFYILVDGQNVPVHSWNQNAGVILETSKVKINPQDEISISKRSNLVPGEQIVITRINEVNITTNETVPFDTKTVTSNNVAFGQSEVVQAGANGQMQKTYHVVYKDGNEVSRWLVSYAVTVPVQNKIIARGSVTGRANFGYYSGSSTSFYKGLTGHHLLVTNLANGKQVTVTIIGSGPFDGPIMDMGTAPFQAIGGSLSSGYIPSVSAVLLD